MELPEVSHKDLLIWDKRRSECSGYLNKKASQSSAFSKGRWQKRWFFINIDVEDDENYHLEYFHSPEDTAPRQIFPLVYSSIKISSGNSFVLTLFDGSVLTLSTDSSDLLSKWVTTIENVTAVANLREKVLQEYERKDGMGSDSSAVADSNRGNNRNASRGASPTRGASTSKSYADSAPTDNGTNANKSAKPYTGGSIYRNHSKFTPSVRLDVDINTIPPSSTARHQFKEHFIADVARFLEISPDMVEVVGVKPAPGVDWLTIVEFDIVVYAAETEGGSESNTSTYQQSVASERIQLRTRLLWRLQDMVQDNSSPIYNGLITSKLDPSYTNHIVPSNTAQGGSYNGYGESDQSVFSSDTKILAILNKYKDMEVPSDVPDISHFTVLLYFENKVYPLSVPNPQVLTKRCCAIWPFEVKQLLGFIGNMQELWIEPIGLIPRDQAKSVTTPILFEPSVRLDGAKVISATRLSPDCSYDVQCEDRRDEALNSLSREEMDAIKETFQKYDINGDGGISKKEMEELVRIRTADRVATIEEKFQAYLREAQESGGGISEEEMGNIENNKAQYLQQVWEAQAKLLKMFEAADINGDGVISFTEFIMSEAWWLRCTINPDKAHLF